MIDHDAPIFVTGPPRSGTTFVQHLLSRHPRITIQGQEPLDFTWGDWLEIVVDGTRFATDSNDRLGYEAPHYAGDGDPTRAARSFLGFVGDYLRGGDDSPRWGAKSLTQCRVAADVVREVWPGTRWIVCVREPFRSAVSLWNTFDRERRHSLETYLDWWRDAVEFAHRSEDARLVQVDRVVPEERAILATALVEFVGESTTAEVRDYVEQWPVVHEVVAANARHVEVDSTTRARILREDPHLARLVEELGYEPSAAPS